MKSNSKNKNKFNKNLINNKNRLNNNLNKYTNKGLD